MNRFRLERLKTHGIPRSREWPALRRAYLRKHPRCAVCNGKRKLQVHHILPFWNHPDLELEPTNLIALCEGNATINCHFRFGHWGNFASKWNPRIRIEAPIWLRRFTAKDMT